MLSNTNIILIFVAYLLGSIPTAVWIGIFFYRKDVREYGSGNSGATNTFRILGKKAGILVLIIDILKGTFSVKLIYFLPTQNYPDEFLIYMQLIFGICALFGHIFPLFAGFRGGKGVATLLGFMFAITPYATLLSVIVFFIVYILSKIISLSSIISSITFPFFIFLVIQDAPSPIKVFSIFISILIIFTHQKNIKRILKGNENKLFVKKQKK